MGADHQRFAKEHLACLLTNRVMLLDVINCQGCAASTALIKVNMRTNSDSPASAASSGVSNPDEASPTEYANALRPSRNRSARGQKADVGVKLIYLSPYSPDFSLIENCLG